MRVDGAWGTDMRACAEMCATASLTSTSKEDLEMCVMVLRGTGFELVNVRAEGYRACVTRAAEWTDLWVRADADAFAPQHHWQP